MHYELYIDVLFLENFMMDSLLLFIVSRIFRWRRKKVSILLGGIFGSVSTCIVMIVSIPIWSKVILFYVGIPVMMLWITEKEHSTTQLVKELFLFYFSAMLLGGILTFFRPYLRYMSLFYMVSVFATCGILAAWKFLQIIKMNQETCCEVTLYMASGVYELQALKDTGNSLTDPLTGEGVHVLDSRVYEQMCKKEGRVETTEASDIRKAEFGRIRYIPYRSIGGSSIMKVFRGRKMCVGKEEKQWIEFPLIGVSESPISEDGHYQLILNCRELR